MVNGGTQLIAAFFILNKSLVSMKIDTRLYGYLECTFKFKIIKYYQNLKL